MTYDGLDIEFSPGTGTPVATVHANSEDPEKGRTSPLTKEEQDVAVQKVRAAAGSTPQPSRSTPDSSPGTCGRILRLPGAQGGRGTAQRIPVLST